VGHGVRAAARDHGHAVTLACRDAAQVGAIARRAQPALPDGDRAPGVDATTIEDAPLGGANLVVVAVPSAAFGEVVAACRAARRS
jgi:glycerol-3-phosphate dehydrogenase